MYPPYDRSGNLLKVGDTVRGVTKNSDVEVTGTVDEIRITNSLNVRLQVGEIHKNSSGDAVSGYHYAESAYLDLVPPKSKTKSEPGESEPAAEPHKKAKHKS